MSVVKCPATDLYSDVANYIITASVFSTPSGTDVSQSNYNPSNLSLAIVI